MWFVYFQGYLHILPPNTCICFCLHLGYDRKFCMHINVGAKNMVPEVPCHVRFYLAICTGVDILMDSMKLSKWSLININN